MENNLQQDERYYLAQKKVKKIKGFYSHLFIYLVVNGIIIVQIYLKTSGDEFWRLRNFSTALFWGIGLLVHGLSVFARNFVFARNWEERKIQEFMEREKTRKWE